MIRAHEPPAVAFASDKLCPAMSARGGQCANRVISVAQDDQGCADQVDANIVAFCGYLLQSGREQPALVKDCLNLPVVPLL